MPRVEVSPFASLRQVEAGDLSVGYAELGPGDGPAVLLLHGWPYDIHAYAEVAPILADAGYRVIVPHLRGYGTTRFRKDDAPRNAQQAALGRDAIELLDALDIDRAILGGFDWGARSADVVAASCRMLHRARVGERVPDREPARQRIAVAAASRAGVVVPVLPPPRSAAASATRSTGTTSTA